MLGFLLIPLALATPSALNPQVELVDSACEAVQELSSGDTLELTYQEVAQACEPQGPCETIHDEPLSARRLELWQGDWGVPVHGKFVPAKRTCGDRPVWRWRGELPAGPYAVRAYPDSLARVAVAGEPSSRESRVEVGQARRVREEREETTRPIPLGALAVRGEGQGTFVVSLDLAEAGLGTFAGETPVLEATVEGPARPEHVLAGLPLDESGRPEARWSRESWAEVRELRAGRHEECETTQHHRFELVLAGGAELSFSGEVALAPRHTQAPCEEAP